MIISCLSVLFSSFLAGSVVGGSEKLGGPQAGRKHLLARNTFSCVLVASTFGFLLLRGPQCKSRKNNRGTTSSASVILVDSFIGTSLWDLSFLESDGDVCPGSPFW